MKNNKFMSNNNFLSYGLGVFLYVNTLFELKLEYFGFKMSEVCIIGILLFVFIFIINEINKILLDNYKEKSIKYYYETNCFGKFRNSDGINLEKEYKKLSPIYIINKNSYKVFISLIQK